MVKRRPSNEPNATANVLDEAQPSPNEAQPNPNQSNPAEEESWNKLNFPGHPETFQYDLKDFIYLDIIESSRHIVKEYKFAPLKIKMAVKTVRIQQNKHQDNDANQKIGKLKHEAVKFRDLSAHPNIVDFYGLCINDGEAMICMELMDISLYDLYLGVHEENDEFSEEILGYITIQVLEGLMFCKSKNYIHRDVKPKNILLNGQGEVKLCDFGESRILQDSFASTFVGTIAYWPPERFTGAKTPSDALNTNYDIRADVWSLGITLAETAYGSIPFLNADGLPFLRDENSQGNIIAVQHCILSTEANELVDRCFEKGAYSESMIDFVKQCLDKYETRPKYNKLVESRFYKEMVVKKDGKEVMKKFLEKYQNDDDEDDIEINQTDPGNSGTPKANRRASESSKAPASIKKKVRPDKPWPTV